MQRSDVAFGSARWTRRLEQFCNLPVVLALIAVAYLVGYLGNPVRPGKDPGAPSGWWGWFDQGQYLLSARAISHLDFAPANHYYPPLYPLAGALFVRIWPNHPFWLIDLVSLLWFSAVFILLASRYVPRWTAVLLLVLSTVAEYGIFNTFLIPWTTTLGAALLSTGIYGILRLRDAANPRPTAITVFVTSLALGLMAALRPTDVFVAGVIWIGYLWGARHIGVRGLFAAAIPAFLVGPAIFLGFNHLVSGSPLGTYLAKRWGEGYFLPDLPEKFASLFLDGYTLYLEPHAGLIDHYPWLVLALVGIAYVLIRGDWVLRIIAAAVCTQLILLLPYGDWLPNGTWRYWNVHFLAWLFPYLAFFAWSLVAFLVDEWRAGAKRRLVWIGLAAGVMLLLASLRVQLQSRDIPVLGHSTSTSLSFQLNPVETDLIDLIGVHGEFNDVYFGNHRLCLDGHELHLMSEFRVLPAPWGIRVLFIRPVRGRTADFQPDAHLVRSGNGLRAIAGIYHFALGIPKPFWDEEDAIPPAICQYNPGEVVDFSDRGKSAFYTRNGWAGLEPWGRWTYGHEARLRLKLDHSNRGPLLLQASMRSLVSDKYPQQTAEVNINGRPLGRLTFRVEQGADKPQNVSLEVPPGLVGEDGNLSLVLKTPDSISPVQLGISTTDNRVLGLGVFWLRLTSPSQPEVLPKDVTSGPATTGPIEVKWGTGSYGEETGSIGTWHWCAASCEVLFINPTNKEIRVRVSTGAQSGYQQTAKLTITGPSLSDSVPVNVVARELSYTIALPPGQHVLKFHCDAKRVEAPADSRLLVFRLINFALTSI